MLGTKGRLLVAGIILGSAAFLVLRRPSPPTRLMQPLPPSSGGHAAEIDHSMAAIVALEVAPEGNTPCESAYNAFKASKDVSDSQGVKAVVHMLAPRDEFLVRCAELPPAAQACLVPKYSSRHRNECDHARATPENLSPFVELLQKAAPVEEHEVLPAPLPASSSAH